MVRNGGKRCFAAFSMRFPFRGERAEADVLCHDHVCHAGSPSERTREHVWELTVRLWWVTPAAGTKRSTVDVLGRSRGGRTRRLRGAGSPHSCSTPAAESGPLPSSRSDLPRTPPPTGQRPGAPRTRSRTWRRPRTGITNDSEGSNLSFQFCKPRGRGSWVITNHPDEKLNEETS